MLDQNIGDVRDLSLLTSFHAAVAAARARGRHPVDEGGRTCQQPVWWATDSIDYLGCS
ncbi:hypothetical protein ACOBQX_08385 [Actinokineospora sp. G85]|uniref:hypothetical protein n=1 Tax=Actinokineospora sp. G85 TaxID=3406626 RepID=UPI003C72F470